MFKFKLISFITVFLGLGLLSLIFSFHPALIIGPALIGFGLGVLMCT
jgi:hypothetical protein